MNRRRRAQLLYRVAGYLSRIRTPQRSYRIVNDDAPPIFEFAGWVWSSCVLSVRLAEWSMQMDWNHWDHWALVHDGCGPTPCLVCGGCSCDDEWLGQEIENAQETP